MLLILAAVGLLAIWQLAQRDWFFNVRLNLLFSGYPIYELRDETGGSRPPQAADWGLAYRRSVYVGGRYVGLIERFGAFIPVDAPPGQTLTRRAEFGALAKQLLLLSAPWLAGVCLGFAIWLVCRGVRTDDRSEPDATGDGATRRA